MLISQCNAVGAEAGGLLTEESEVKACWAGYFELLYQADPTAFKLDVRSFTIPIADLCGNVMQCHLPLFVETQAVVNR